MTDIHTQRSKGLGTSKASAISLSLKARKTDIHTPQSKGLGKSKASANSLSLKSRKAADSVPLKSLPALLDEGEELKRLKKNLSYTKYIAQNIDTVSRKGGAFASTIVRLGDKIQECF